MCVACRTWCVDLVIRQRHRLFRRLVVTASLFEMLVLFERAWSYAVGALAKHFNKRSLDRQRRCGWLDQQLYCRRICGVVARR